MFCATCGKELTRNRRLNFPPSAGMFCSIGCLRRHVFSQTVLPRRAIEDLGIRTAPLNWGDRNCFSPFLGVSFRSWFECSVAEFVVRNWKTQIFYEAHSLPLDDRHCYIPDFWLPERGVWLEVKGEWRLGAKSKFERAQAVLGANRLLLIPELYRPWFRRTTRHDCQKIAHKGSCFQNRDCRH